MYSDSDRVIALAGVFQAAKITWQMARKGVTDAQALEASINSLFQMQPDSVASVFGGVQGVTFGLRCLLTQFEDPQNRSLEITQYSIVLLQLAKKLGSDPKAQDELGNKLGDLESRLDAFNMNDNSRFAQLDRIYQENVSVLSPRIMVKGEPAYLQNPDNAARIRAVLLAGVRAGHLWYQCGGTRWKLVLQRKQIVNIARQLLNAA